MVRLTAVDAYYLDDESRKYLRREKMKYLAAINPVRFKEVWEELGVHVQKPGHWVDSYNKDTKEHAIMRWDPLKGDRKQHVLSNAFENRKKLSKKEQKQMAEFVVGLTNVLEEVVDDAIGQRYNREDRKKIAMGMMAIIVTEKIPLERLKEQVLLMAIKARSVEVLSAQGEITTR